MPENEKLGLLYNAMKEDEVFSQVVPNDVQTFVKEYSDPKTLRTLYDALSKDEVFSQVVPDSFEAAVKEYGLGKPSAVPSSGLDGGSATKGRSVELRSTLPTTLTAKDVQTQVEQAVPAGGLANIDYEQIAQKMQGKTPMQAMLEQANQEQDPVKKVQAKTGVYKLAANEASVKNTEIQNTLKQFEQGLEQMKGEIAAGEQDYQRLLGQDVNAAELVRQQLEQQVNDYNSALEQAKQLDKEYNQNATFISTMNAGRQAEFRLAQKNGDMKRGQLPIGTAAMSNMFGASMPFSPTDAFDASAWNAIAPNLVRTLSAVTQLVPFTGEAGKDMGDSLLSVADALELETEKFTPKSSNVSLLDERNMYNVSKAAGSLVGSIAGSLGSGGMAGGTGAMMFNASQGFGDMYAWGKKAGLSSNEAIVLSLPVAAVYGYLGDKGVESVAGMFGKQSFKKLIQEGVKGLGEKPTQEALLTLGKRLLVDGLKGAAKEGAQEGVEFTIEFGTKDFAQDFGMVNVDDDLSMEAFEKGLLESMAVGAVGGGIFGAGLGSARSSIADVAAQYKKDPKVREQYIADVNSLVQSGKITNEEADQATAALDKAIEITNKIPNSVTNEQAISEAVQLIEEKEQLTAEIENIEPAMAKPMVERVASIDQRLSDIAEGKIETTVEDIQQEQEGLTSIEQPVTPNETIDLTPTEKVSDVINSPSDVFVYNGEKGTVYQEGKTVVFETKDRIYEIGNVDEISSKNIDEIGIERESVIDIVVNEDNSVNIEGDTYFNNYSNPSSAINYDSDGNVISVNLETENGDKRTFRGQRAEGIAYQYKLKSFEENATDRQIESAIEQAEKTIKVERIADEAAPKRKGKSVRKRKQGEKLTQPTQQPTSEVSPSSIGVKGEVAVVESSAETIEAQIENFGVARANVQPVASVIGKLFESLKKAGLTTAKTVGEWVGIGKGKEKPYSLKINGKDTQVKNVSLEVVNGFYSPLEKVITESKFDKLPAKQWIEKFAKGEEAKWTGLTDWLSQQEGSVSKSDIQKYLKENRIEVVEVVKGGERGKDYSGRIQEIERELESKGYSLELDMGGDGYMLIDEDGELADYDTTPSDILKIHEEYNEIQDAGFNSNLKLTSDDTKFGNYQLEGQKENYKEVLVLLPPKKIKGDPYHIVRDKYLIPALEKIGLRRSEEALRRMKIYEGQGRVEEFKNDPDYPKAKQALDELKKQGYDDVLDRYSAGFAVNAEIEKQRAAEFKSSHFDEPNILVHLRMNTRTDADGKKVLFLEEVQSDWGQEGKRKGFEVDKSEKIKELEGKLKQARDKQSKETDFLKRGEIYQTEVRPIEFALFEAKGQNRLQKTPAAPFVMDTNAWTKLALKVALKEAVAQGTDKIAWTTGEQQNDRYDLSKSVDNIEVSNQGEGVGYKVVGIKGGNVLMTQFATAQQLPDVIGKELAQKIIDAKIPYQKTKTFSGVDLKLGGKGMKGFYGSPTEGSLGIVGNVAKSLFKQEPKTVNIDANERGKSTKDFEGLKESLQFEKQLADKGKTGIVSTVNKDGSYTIEWNENKPSIQHSIDITPELKSSVEGGQPLFKEAEAQYRIENGKNIIEAIEDFNGSPKSTVALTHEIMHPTVVSIIDGAADGNEVGIKHTQTIVNEFNKANPKSKITVDELITGNNAFKEGNINEQYRDVQEFIAESWEKYHIEGAKGFSEAFQRVLKQITEAFRTVYKTLTSKQLTPELRQMFDDILGKQEVSPEIANIASQLQAAIKEEVNQEAEAIIKEDSEGLPSKEELTDAQKVARENLAKKIDDFKKTYGELFNKNLSIIYDPKVEAQKMYNMHAALVGVMRAAIQSGVADIKAFAAMVGKTRIDKFTERAWRDAELLESGQPAIINNKDEMMNATYQKVAEAYNDQYEDVKKARKTFFKRVIEFINTGFDTADYVAMRALKTLGATQARIDKQLITSASGRAKTTFDDYAKRIFGGLNSKEKIILNNIIQARTIISIDERFDAKGEKRPLHPKDMTMEDQKVFLGIEAESNPKLYEKLSDRADAYFAANRQLLRERLDEGRISIEQYNAMINNEYSPRVFLEFLIEENQPKGSSAFSPNDLADIKSLDEGSVNSLFHDAEWLLSANVMATNSVIYRNRANRSLYEFAKDNPNNTGELRVQNPIGLNDKGEPIYPKPKYGYSQIQYKEDGVLKSLTAPTEFANSWGIITPLMSPVFANAVRNWSGGSILRTFATAINPLFAIVNFPRDVSHALFFTNTYSPTFPVALAQMSKDLLITSKAALKLDVRNKDGIYYKYLEEGGATDYLTAQANPVYGKSVIDSEFQKAVKGMASVFGFFNNRTEIWVRLAIRQREQAKLTRDFIKKNNRIPTIKEQRRIDINATAASKIQMDFSRGGTMAKAIDNFIPYFNARLQGFSVSSRYIADNPAAFTYKFAQAAGLVTALVLYNLRFRDDYEDVAERDKIGNYIIMLPYKVEKDGEMVRPYYKIPKNQSIQPLMTLIESMAMQYETGKMSNEMIKMSLESAMPLSNPIEMGLDIPIVNAAATYYYNKDRFRNQEIFRNAEITPDILEYYEGQTPQMWRDLATELNMSPERLKESVGKITTDPDNNIYFTLMASSYDRVFDVIPEDKQQPLKEEMHKEMLKVLSPFQRKFIGYPNAKNNNKVIREIEEQEQGVKKLQNDVVKKFSNRVIKDKENETLVRREFTSWLNSQPKDSVNVDRLKKRFEFSLKLRKSDSIFFDMIATQNPKARANIFYLEWFDKSDEGKRELEGELKELKLAPIDKNTDFWKEFNRLKASGKTKQ